MANKFHAIKTTIDGVVFDSRKESRRYGELLLLQKANEIRGLELQPKFTLKVNGEMICNYFGDFAYFEGDRRIVEDVKSGPTRTPVYRLKIKLLLALNPGLDHREV